MSCSCPTLPCVCQPQCPPPAATTKCDLYRPGTPNVWVERGSPGAIGICMLDTMDESQVIYTLERDEKARQDLLAVTSDPALRQLAQDVPRLPVVEETDAEQALLNRPNEPSQNPFYAVFRGQPPFAQ